MSLRGAAGWIRKTPKDTADETWFRPEMLADITGAVLVDAVTGESQYYEVADVPEWVNGHEVEVHYGDITDEPFYEDYMGLKTDPESAYHARNSKGENVIIQEEGWAEPGTQPTHMMIHILSRSLFTPL